MALPASGPISLGAIQNEFGGTNPVNIDEYYRGGGLVPANANTVGVPASGTISLDDFHGKSAAGGSFSASITPSGLYAFGTGTVATTGATATPTGGTAPYTYAWTKVSGDTLTVTNPTSATTSFSASVSAGSPTKSAVYKCTITATGGATSSDTVDVSIEWDNGA